MKQVFGVMAMCLVLAACAGKERIIIDEAQSDMTNYEQDRAECESYADQVSVAGDAGKGAVVGAVVGGLVGAAVGNSRSVQKGAGAGAAIGGAQGAGKGVQERHQVIKQCLRNRGYQVLN
ncbi:MAG: glycine zipper family protein [Gammaproteobacteria bacterium]|nr:MAG: glycine zipper family protein [Gammaproteobacteria bacterium]